MYALNNKHTIHFPNFYHNQISSSIDLQRGNISLVTELQKLPKYMQKKPPQHIWVKIMLSS